MKGDNIEPVIIMEIIYFMYKIIFHQQEQQKANLGNQQENMHHVRGEINNQYHIREIDIFQLHQTLDP